jgi:hypothetical protein
MQACDATIRQTGAGCCAACFEADTHGLLDKFRVIDVADHAQEIQNLTRLAAQTVIGFGEHAKAIRRLQADYTALVEENALLRGKLQEWEHTEATIDQRVKARLMTAVLGEVRTLVQNLPERVQELEDVVRALENHFGLRRRPKGRRGEPSEGKKK